MSTSSYASSEFVTMAASAVHFKLSEMSTSEAFLCGLEFRGGGWNARVRRPRLRAVVESFVVQIRGGEPRVVLRRGIACRQIREGFGGQVVTLDAGVHSPELPERRFGRRRAGKIPHDL